MQKTYSDELLKILKEKEEIENDTIYSPEEKQRLLAIISTYFTYKYFEEQITSKRAEYGSLANQFIDLEYPNTDNLDGVEFGVLAGKIVEESKTMAEFRKKQPDYSPYNYDNLDWNFKCTVMETEPENFSLITGTKLIESYFDIVKAEKAQIDRVARDLIPVLGEVVISRYNILGSLSNNAGQTQITHNPKSKEEYLQCMKQAISEVQGISLLAPTVGQYLEEMVNSTFKQYIDGQQQIVVQRQVDGKSY